MPRPIRIQYEHAYYHVMNRGRARQTIFHGAGYYEDFLTTLEECHTRFKFNKIALTPMNFSSVSLGAPRPREFALPGRPPPGPGAPAFFCPCTDSVGFAVGFTSDQATAAIATIATRPIGLTMICIQVLCLR